MLRPVCESAELLCDAVNKSYSDFNLPNKYHEIIQKIFCELLSEDCAYRNCVDFPLTDLKDLSDVESVRFYSWIQGEKGTTPSN